VLGIPVKKKKKLKRKIPLNSTTSSLCGVEILLKYRF
jgi:hypothetical protein